MKESYENMKFLLEEILYDEYKLKICRDLKVIALLLGLQFGYIILCCFIYKWDNRYRKNHYVKKLAQKKITYSKTEK